MFQFIQAKNIGIAYLKERFGLAPTDNEALFTECWLILIR
jgi:hypothetical protein